MWLSTILDLIFPTRCVGCNLAVPHDSPLCPACFARVRIAPNLLCGACRIPCVSPVSLCHPQFPYLLGAATRYKDPCVRGAIRALKFANMRTAAAPLAELLVRYMLLFSEFVAARPRPIVAPIPLHPSRERARGFNQLELIAERFASHFQLELCPSLLVRTRATSPQSEIKDRAARAVNVRECFALGARRGLFSATDHPLHSGAASALRGATVILIDDVVTSGATFFEAATALKAGGAERVLALAVAAA